MDVRCAFLTLATVCALLTRVTAYELRDGAYHVFPGDDLQAALNAAATNSTVKTVKLHEGVYRPRKAGQALVYLNRRHDAIHLEGVGRVTLSAANPEIVNPTARGFPALVNHVIYLGDGLSSNTVVRHLRLTGANHFVTTAALDEMEPDRELRKGRFYFGDGGAIKIYRRSYPVLRDLEIVGNYASPCAGGISIQQEGASQQPVRIEACVFRDNRAEVTGGALDLLWGSSASVVDCLFVGNASNTGPGEGYNPYRNNGVVTIFPRSRGMFEHCTFTGNRNGVDDMGGLSEYRWCVLCEDQLDTGLPGQARFELDLQRGGKVRDCLIAGKVLDPLGAVNSANNLLDPAGFRLGRNFLPTTPAFAPYGYRLAVRPNTGGKRVNP
jgi:hypothetical protein